MNFSTVVDIGEHIRKNAGIQDIQCIVFYSLHAENSRLYTYNFDEQGSAIRIFIDSLLRKVSDTGKDEKWDDIQEHPLVRAEMAEMKGAAYCYPICTDKEKLGAFFVWCSRKLEQNDEKAIDHSVQKAVQIYADQLRLRAEQARQARSYNSSIEQAKVDLAMGLEFDTSEGTQKIISIAPAMQEKVFARIQRYRNCSPLIIYGETGTGKELVAAALHYKSNRRNETLLCFNCAEMASADPQMQRIELFGCISGVASGVEEREGLLSQAHKGTLFLDEIGSLSMEAQGHLLRVLEDGKIRRVGEKDSSDSDIRFISANNKPLKQLVAKGSFREDLYYRLVAYVIHIPPLRERKEDIGLLVDYFLQEENRKHRSRYKRMTMAAREKLLQYHWPGNVRELENTIRKAFHNGSPKSSEITEKDITFEPVAKLSHIPRLFPFPEPLSTLTDLKKEFYRQVWEWVCLNKPRKNDVAKQLEMTSDTLHKKLQQYIGEEYAAKGWPKR